MGDVPDPQDVVAFRRFRDESFYRLLLRSLASEREVVLGRLRSLGYSDSLEVQDLSFIANCEADGRSITQLAKQIGVTRQAASQRVTILERQGLLERTPDSRDSRVVLVRRTEAANQLLADSIDVVTGLEDRHREVMGEAFGELKRLLAEHLDHVDPEGLLAATDLERRFGT